MFTHMLRGGNSKLNGRVVKRLDYWPHTSLTGLNNVRIIMVRWRASILSLGSGDGIPVLVGQNGWGIKATAGPCRRA